MEELSNKSEEPFIDPEEDEIFIGEVPEHAQEKWKSVCGRKTIYMVDTMNNDPCFMETTADVDETKTLDNTANTSLCSEHVHKLTPFNCSTQSRISFVSNISLDRIVEESPKSIRSDKDLKSTRKIKIPTMNLEKVMENIEPVLLNENSATNNSKEDNEIENLNSSLSRDDTPLKVFHKSLLETPRSTVEADKDGGFLHVLSEIALVRAESENTEEIVNSPEETKPEILDNNISLLGQIENKENIPKNLKMKEYFNKISFQITNSPLSTTILDNIEALKNVNIDDHKDHITQNQLGKSLKNTQIKENMLSFVEEEDVINSFEKSSINTTNTSDYTENKTEVVSDDVGSDLNKSDDLLVFEPSFADAAAGNEIMDLSQATKVCFENSDKINILGGEISNISHEINDLNLTVQSDAEKINQVNDSIEVIDLYASDISLESNLSPHELEINKKLTTDELKQPCDLSVERSPDIFSCTEEELENILKNEHVRSKEIDNDFNTNSQLNETFDIIDTSFGSVDIISECEGEMIEHNVSCQLETNSSESTNQNEKCILNETLEEVVLYGPYDKCGMNYLQETPPVNVCKTPDKHQLSITEKLIDFERSTDSKKFTPEKALTERMEPIIIAGFKCSESPIHHELQSQSIIQGTCVNEDVNSEAIEEIPPTVNTNSDSSLPKTPKCEVLIAISTPTPVEAVAAKVADLSINEEIHDDSIFDLDVLKNTVEISENFRISMIGHPATSKLKSRLSGIKESVASPKAKKANVNKNHGLNSPLIKQINTAPGTPKTPKNNVILRGSPVAKVSTPRTQHGNASTNQSVKRVSSPLIKQINSTPGTPKSPKINATPKDSPSAKVSTLKTQNVNNSKTQNLNSPLVKKINSTQGTPKTPKVSVTPRGSPAANVSGLNISPNPGKTPLQRKSLTPDSKFVRSPLLKPENSGTNTPVKRSTTSQLSTKKSMGNVNTPKNDGQSPGAVGVKKSTPQRMKSADKKVTDGAKERVTRTPFVSPSDHRNLYSAKTPGSKTPLVQSKNLATSVLSAKIKAENLPAQSIKTPRKVATKQDGKKVLATPSNEGKASVTRSNEENTKLNSAVKTTGTLSKIPLKRAIPTMTKDGGSSVKTSKVTALVDLRRTPHRSAKKPATSSTTSGTVQKTPMHPSSDRELEKSTTTK